MIRLKKYIIFLTYIRCHNLICIYETKKLLEWKDDCTVYMFQVLVLNSQMTMKHRVQRPVYFQATIYFNL